MAHRAFLLTDKTTGEILAINWHDPAPNQHGFITMPLNSKVMEVIPNAILRKQLQADLEQFQNAHKVHPTRGVEKKVGGKPDNIVGEREIP